MNELGNWQQVPSLGPALQFKKEEEKKMCMGVR